MIMQDPMFNEMMSVFYGDYIKNHVYNLFLLSGVDNDYNDREICYISYVLERHGLTGLDGFNFSQNISKEVLELKRIDLNDSVEVIFNQLSKNIKKIPFYLKENYNGIEELGFNRLYADYIMLMLLDGKIKDEEILMTELFSRIFNHGLEDYKGLREKILIHYHQLTGGTMSVINDDIHLKTLSLLKI